MKKVSILIPSYLESKRLYQLTKSILNDKCKNKVEKIVIVSPDFNLPLPKSKKIILIKEKKRKGKSYAIKLGLSKIDSKTVVLLPSDIKMRKNFLCFLLKHFKNDNVGMVIGRPIADKNSRIYKFSKIIWDLHHFLCLKNPKGTEIIAFRNLIKNFPIVSADEVFIEYFIRLKGLKIVYEPKAYGYTLTPSSFYEFFLQRKRSFIGHLQIKKKYKFVTSSMKLTILLSILLSYVKKKKLNFNLLILILIEFFARLFGFFEFYILKNEEIVWKKFKR